VLHVESARGDQRKLSSAWKETVGVIVSLPDRLANKLKADVDPFFFPEYDSPLLAFSLSHNPHFFFSSSSRNFATHFFHEGLYAGEKEEKPAPSKEQLVLFWRLGFSQTISKFCVLGKTGQSPPSSFSLSFGQPSKKKSLVLAEFVDTLFPLLTAEVGPKPAVMEWTLLTEAVPESQRDVFVDLLLKRIQKSGTRSKTFFARPSPFS